MPKRTPGERLLDAAREMRGLTRGEQKAFTEALLASSKLIAEVKMPDSHPVSRAALRSNDNRKGK